MVGKTKRWLALSVTVGLFGVFAGGQAHAGLCSAPAAWNPDPAVSNAVACGPGNSGNDTAADLNAAENVAGYNLNWSLIDKDESPIEVAGALRFTGSTSGFWYINKDLTTSNVFALVIKDGSSLADPVRWAWFIVDTALSTAGGCTLSFGADYCGTWSMYGNSGQPKEISHMSLYGATGPDKTVSEPGTLALASLGLLAFWTTRRRRRG